MIKIFSLQINVTLYLKKVIANVGKMKKKIILLITILSLAIVLVACGCNQTKKDDMTTQTAIIQDGTNKVLTTISGDERGIGYVSIGSLNDSVKVLKIDGVEATEEKIFF